MKQGTKCARAVTHKLAELKGLEHRLRAAASRAEEAGYVQRASSYTRQIAAVRRERERWLLLEQAPPSPPAATPYLVATGLAVVAPVADLLVSGGQAARRLARLIFALGLITCATLLGSSRSSAWDCRSCRAPRPVPWGREIAKTELPRKNFSSTYKCTSFGGPTVRLR